MEDIEKFLEDLELRKILNNKIRFYILLYFKEKSLTVLLKTFKKGFARVPVITITELHSLINEELKTDYSYKAVHKQLIFLKGEKLIKFRQEKHQQGRPIYVFPNFEKGSISPLWFKIVELLEEMLYKALDKQKSNKNLPEKSGK